MAWFFQLCCLSEGNLSIYDTSCHIQLAFALEHGLLLEYLNLVMESVIPEFSPWAKMCALCLNLYSFSSSNFSEKAEFLILFAQENCSMIFIPF